MSSSLEDNRGTTGIDELHLQATDYQSYYNSSRGGQECVYHISWQYIL